MSEKLTGSCQCQAVRYEAGPEVMLLGNCHCNLCKKITGAAMSSIAIIAEDDFAVVKGADQLTTCAVSVNVDKNFCRHCGTPIFNAHKMYPGKRMVFLGSFDDPNFAAPVVNLHCENRLPWIFAIESLKNFEQGMG